MEIQNKKNMNSNTIRILTALIILGSTMGTNVAGQNAEGVQPKYEQSRFEKKIASDPPVTYKGEYLTGIDFPVGALGGSVIRMNGKAERQWWQIFNNFEERAGSGIVPNSFFAIRTKSKGNGKPVVRVL